MCRIDIAMVTAHAGMAQALNYAELLNVPFSFTSNGDGFVFRDGTLAAGVLEQIVVPSRGLSRSPRVFAPSMDLRAIRPLHTAQPASRRLPPRPASKRLAPHSSIVQQMSRI
jgi:type I site-specific restriction endonuclease